MVAAICRKKLAYFGHRHIVRHDGMEERVLEAHIPGKQSRGRPRCRWDRKVEKASKIAQYRHFNHNAVIEATQWSDCAATMTTTMCVVNITHEVMQCLLWNMVYKFWNLNCFFSSEEPSLRAITEWIVCDLATKPGRQLVQDALKNLVSNNLLLYFRMAKNS